MSCGKESNLEVLQHLTKQYGCHVDKRPDDSGAIVVRGGKYHHESNPNPRTMTIHSWCHS